MVSADCENTYNPALPGLGSGNAMDDLQFEQWRELLESRTGMTVARERRSFLEANLSTRMRELGFKSYQSYYEKILYGPGAVAEWATLVDRLTVQETRFFRDEDAFALIEKHARTLFKERERHAVEAWSLGCSTGEEAYTLGMILAQTADSMPGKRYFGVSGSDISLIALNKARAARYGPRKLVTTPAYWQEQFFHQIADGSLEIIPELRDRVSFSQLNILELKYAPMHGMDIIFCQNVLIYFRRWRRREIANRLAERLAPGGLLILGHGELTNWQHPELEPVANSQVLAWQRTQSPNDNRSDYGQSG